MNPNRRDYLERLQKDAKCEEGNDDVTVLVTEPVEDDEGYKWTLFVDGEDMGGGTGKSVALCYRDAYHFMTEAAMRQDQGTNDGR